MSDQRARLVAIFDGLVTGDACPACIPGDCDNMSVEEILPMIWTHHVPEDIEKELADMGHARPILDEVGGTWQPSGTLVVVDKAYGPGSGPGPVTEGLGNAALRAEIADLRNELEVLASRVAYLESKRGGGR